MQMLSISNSEISTFERCKRKWYVNYYLGFQPAEERAASNRNLGTRVHIAMEAWCGYQMDPLAVLDALYAIELGAHPDEERELLAELEMAQIMVEGYLEWAASDPEEADWAVVGTEADVRMPLAVYGLENVELRARLDQVAMRRSDGRLAFRDWKTAANFERHELMALDPQMKFYSMLQQLTSGPEAPLKVNAGRVTTMRRVKRTSRSTPPYYRSDDFPYNPEQIDSALRRALGACEDIRDARAALGFLGDNADARQVNDMLREQLRPTVIMGDCSWSCPHASGLCGAMDDGSSWPEILTASGRYVQADPYGYYEKNPLASLRAAM